MYAPGDSPFHARGSTYIAVQEYVQAKLPGGMSSVVAAVPEGPHRDFAMQKFASDAWYDALPLRPITERIAMLEGIDWEASICSHAEHRAQQQLGMLGRMRMRTPDKALEQLEREGIEGFNFGKSEFVATDQARARLLFHEVPQPLGSWFLANSRGFGQVLLAHAGAKQVVVGGRLIPKGRQDRMGLVDVRVDINWT